MGNVSPCIVLLLMIAIIITIVFLSPNFFKVVKQHRAIRKLLVNDLDHQYLPYTNKLDDCIEEYTQAIAVSDYKMKQLKDTVGESQIDSEIPIMSKCDAIPSILQSTVCCNKICSIYYKEYMEIKGGYNKLLSYREKMIKEKMFNLESINNREFRIIMTCKNQVREYIDSDILMKIRHHEYLMYQLDLDAMDEAEVSIIMDAYIKDNNYVM